GQVFYIIRRDTMRLIAFAVASLVRSDDSKSGGLQHWYLKVPAQPQVGKAMQENYERTTRLSCNSHLQSKTVYFAKQFCTRWRVGRHKWLAVLVKGQSSAVFSLG